MRALYSVEQAVRNLKNVRKIDPACLALLKSAFGVSIRLKNPIIITEIPGKCTSDIFTSEIPVIKPETGLPSN